MLKELLSIREITEPIIGGFWGQTVEKNQSGNARVVRNGDILESGYISQKVPERLLSDKELIKSKLKKGDILITMSGNVGRVARVKEEIDVTGKFFVASNFVKILRTNKNIDPEFLYFYLKSKDFQSKINKYTRGVAIQNLSTKVFDEKLIPDLSLIDQKRISLILDQVEKLKNKRQEANKKMDNLIPGLFKDFFTKEEYKKEKIVNLVIDKNSIRTGPFGSQLHHHEFTEIGIPVLGIDNVVKNKFRWTYKRCLPQDKFNKFLKFEVYPGDVLVTIMGTVGRVVVAPENIPKCMSTKHLCVITTDKGKINPIYLWASLLFDNNIRRQTQNVSKGAIMEGWNSTIIKNLLISLPPIELQNKFAGLVKEIELQKEKQVQSTQMIDELFDTIMAKYFK